MLKTVEGVIIRTVKYGESSVILDLLTLENGVQSFIVSGVRAKGKKNKSSLVSVLNLVKVEAYFKNNDKLSRIKEIAYSYIYKSIPFDVIKASIATFLIEVCRKSLKSSDDLREVYNYIVKGLIHLDNLESGLAHFHISFLIGLAKHLGFELSDNYDEQNIYFDLKYGSFKPSRVDHRLSLDKEHSKYLHAYLQQQNFDSASRQIRQGLLLSIVDYYRYHIEGFGELKSLDILVSLYES